MRKLIALAAALFFAAILSACAGKADEPIGDDIIAPVTMTANELQGAKVELEVGQSLNIDTESLAVDSYTGEVADSRVAEFTAGRKDGSAEYNPGVTGLAPGETEVTMTNRQGGIQPLTFTVQVTER